MTIELSEYEIMFCYSLANMRQLANYSAGKLDRINSGSEFIDVTIDGIIGEYGFCKLKNVFMDCSMQPRVGSYDLFFMGKRFDIKTTRKPDGNLIVRRNNTDVDIYCLAILDGRKIYYPGYATKDDVIRPENIFTINNDRVYRVMKNNLRKWKESTTESWR